MSEQSYLLELECQSIYIIREAFFNCRQPAMLWSMGKDSTVMLWLVRKAFAGDIPFPVVHIDTTYKIPEMITYRNKMSRLWNLDLIVGKNEEALQKGISYKSGRLKCCEELKTNALKDVILQNEIDCLFLGIRGDEEASRSKERIFSPRTNNFEWKSEDQPIQVWDNYYFVVPFNGHVRVHPILHWNEIDVWRYIKQEEIPVIDLYFSKNGKRYRSIGCQCCTEMIDSSAKDVDEIIHELENIQFSERSTRSQDQEEDYAMEKLRTRGYM